MFLRFFKWTMDEDSETTSMLLCAGWFRTVVFLGLVLVSVN
jgi:hypothetical protein